MEATFSGPINIAAGVASPVVMGGRLPSIAARSNALRSATVLVGILPARSPQLAWTGTWRLLGRGP